MRPLSSSLKFLCCLTLILVTAVPLISWTINPLLSSLVIPGSGQISHNQKQGYVMLASEVLLWSASYYTSNEISLQNRSTYEYALKFAHIYPGSYDSQYYRDLAKYNSSGYEAGGYNAMIRQQAIQLYPNDPIQQQLYIDENIYPDDYAWNWDSVEHRGAYSKIRIKTQDLRDYGTLAVGVLIVNHLISGVDVLRSHSETKRSQVWLDIKDRHPMLMLNYKW